MHMGIFHHEVSGKEHRFFSRNNMSVKTQNAAFGRMFQGKQIDARYAFLAHPHQSHASAGQFMFGLGEISAVSP